MFTLNLKLYFKKFPHLFTVLGFIIFFLLIGVFISIPIIIYANNTLVDSVSKSLQKFGSINADQLFGICIDKLMSLNWSDPGAILVNNLLNKDWLMSTFKEAFCASGGTEDLFNQIKDEVTNSFSVFMGGYFLSLIFIFVFFTLGVAGSFIFIKIYLDLGVKNNSIGRYIIFLILHVIFVVGLFILSSWLSFKWEKGLIFIAIGGFILIVVLSILESYLVYGKGKIKMNEVFNFKNILGLILSSFIVYGVSFVIVFLLYKFFSPGFAIVIAVPLVIFTLVITDLTSKTYVCNKLENIKIENKVNKRLKEKEAK